MKKKCPNCKLVNFADAQECVRCRTQLVEVSSSRSQKGEISTFSKFLKRTAVLIFAILFSLFGFYLSLIFSSKPLSYNEKQIIGKASALLNEKGFSKDASLLNYLTTFRADDNWLNASIEKENAYAATNFPFEIMTIYPDFFQFSTDDTERAAILLHEAQHLKGADEREAYEYVWKNRRRLGWTKENYSNSIIWQNVRKQTKEYAPELFVCQFNDFSDCTEDKR